ncbi:single-stranded DNA-binding protein [Phaeodactylibacter luteus]|uniref:Single-stranded DNA-binding protein n=1 Tax=Phaeodactylibacter luteus TaxID=1564516 RepID=A0A5C6RP23_9BACT|nr:single-stranded DNA-binding protein [Phaeodactylibacter luteus]TXB63142.1 single-stranded DNA-binding protein [Phaeodactylibacter luteus]
MNGIRNSITLIGHIGQDAKIIETTNGNTLANVSLATNDSYKNKQGDRVTTTEWHRCVAWGKLAEVMGNLCKKGKEVAVRGKLTYNTYQDKNGVQRTQPQVVVQEFVLLDRKKQEGEQ